MSKFKLFLMVSYGVMVFPIAFAFQCLLLVIKKFAKRAKSPSNYKEKPTTMNCMN